MGDVIAPRRASVAAFAIAVACLCAASPAQAAAFFDDFNRASGTDLGPNWVERTGDNYIVGDSYVRSVGNGVSLMTVANFNETAPILSVDAGYPSQNFDVGYVALVGRYADDDNSVYVKVQSTGINSQNGFDRLFFYYGTDGGAWPGMTGGEAGVPITPFRNGRLTVTIAGSDVTASIDTDFNGTPEQTFTRGGLPLANLGTQVGLGMLSLDVAIDADNFSAVPEPTAALPLLAASLVLIARRRTRVP